MMHVMVMVRHGESCSDNRGYVSLLTIRIDQYRDQFIGFTFTRFTRCGDLIFDMRLVDACLNLNSP